MNYFLLFLSASLGAATSAVSRIVKKDTGRISVVSANNAATFFVAWLTIFAFGAISVGSGFFAELKNVPIGYAALYGIAMLTAQFFFLFAVGRGPVSVSTLFYSCGFILPTFWGIVRFHEPVGVLQLVGVALVLLSFVLSMGERKDEGKKADWIWCVFAVSAAACSGTVGIVQKEFSKLSACPLDCFLFVAFAFSSLVGVVLAAALGAWEQRKKGKPERGEVKRALWGGLPLGAIMGASNKLNTYLAGVFESVVTFPCVNGGRIVLTAIVSALLFKEKTALRQKIAVVVGVLAIVFISI